MLKSIKVCDIGQVGRSDEYFDIEDHFFKKEIYLFYPNLIFLCFFSVFPNPRKIKLQSIQIED